MPLTVRLDSVTEHCLNELLDETGQGKSSLIRQLIRERWQQRQPRPSITQQLGGHPEAFLDTLPASSAERQQRRRVLGQHLQSAERVADFETNVIRGEACLRAARRLAEAGYYPDAINAHPGCRLACVHWFGRIRYDQFPPPGCPGRSARAAFVNQDHPPARVAAPAWH